MSEMFARLFDSPGMNVLETTWSFANARHRVLAENIANLTTPGYQARNLDYQAFQKSLGKAIDRRSGDTSQPLEFSGAGQVRSDHGRLRFKPSARPAQNVLFHDGTNASVEQEMSDLAQNAMVHELTTQLIGGRFESLRKAIRGRA